MNRIFFVIYISVFFFHCNNNKDIKTPILNENISDTILMKRNIFIIDSSVMNVKRYFYVDSLVDLEKKQKIMDSLYHKTVNLLTRDEWYLDAYKKNKKRYSLKNASLTDTLFFEFTDNGEIIDKRYGNIGEWKLVIQSLKEKAFPRYIILDLKYTHFDDLYIPSKRYKFYSLKKNIIYIGVVVDSSRYALTLRNTNLIIE